MAQMIRRFFIIQLTIFVFAYLLLDSVAFGAKYRTKKALSNDHTGEVPPNLQKNREEIPLVSSTGNFASPSIAKEELKRPFKLITKGQPGYYNRENRALRKAKIIYNSGKGYSAEESLRLAHQQLTDQRRKDGKKSRDKVAQGLKPKKRRRRPGYSDREIVIGRKVASLLLEDNHIVRHQDARKAAEEWYKESGRKRTAEYRARKKEAEAEAEAETLASQMQSKSSDI